MKTISSKAEAFTLSVAGPLITQCEAHARTLNAPASFIISAAFAIVPAVSTMSSTITTFFPTTSPIICIVSTTLARARVLLHKTSGHPKYFA